MIFKYPPPELQRSYCEAEPCPIKNIKTNGTFGFDEWIANSFFQSFNFRIILFLLLSFFFILLSSVTAQVKIKEKVEIKPTAGTMKGLNKTTSGDYFPCGPFVSSNDYANPWQVVWANSIYPFDPAQQAFNYQANAYNNYRVNGHYTVKIVEGKDKVVLEEIFRCDSLTGECPDPISRDLGTKIENVSAYDMEGEGDFMIVGGVPSRIFAGYVRYTIRFIKDGDVTIRYIDQKGDSVDYHTKVVSPDFYLEYAGTTELPHGEEDKIDVDAKAIQCEGEWDFWNGGGLPDSIKFNVSIIEGAQYARLINKRFDEFLFMEVRDTAVSFSGLDNTNELLLAAQGKEPQDTAIVKIRYSTTGGNIQAIEQEIKIVQNPTYPIKVTMSPARLTPGDTSFITLEHRVNHYKDIRDKPSRDVKYEPFAANQLFNIKIERGKQYGTLFSTAAGDTSDAFINEPDGFYFIAKDTIDAENAEISIRAEATIYYFDGFAAASKGNKTKKSSKGKNKNGITGISFPTSFVQIFGIGKAVISEIMLGETKYFQAKQNDSTKALKIEEIQPNASGVPQQKTGTVGDWTWLTENVWGENPVEIVRKNDSYGKRMGVYWEREKPVWDGSTDKGNLAAGLIRIIGRYWNKDSTYVIKLKASRVTNSTFVKIMVVKPGKLLTEGQSPTYEKARDVFDKEFSIDELCIKYGGQYGIPPQMLKGQMKTESATETFTFDDGSSAVGFAPSYRYEPYTTQLSDGMQNILKADINPFIVTKTAMGKPGAASVPTTTEHKYVEFVHYYESPITVWDVIDANSQFTNENNPSTYGYRYKGTSPDERKKGQMKSSSYSLVNDEYQAKLDTVNVTILSKYNLMPGSILTIEQQIEANDSAREELIKNLKDEYEFNGVKGLDNIPAQTRIASSYGLLQLLYTTALAEHNYPTGKQDRPENMNVDSIGMDYSLKHLAKLFKNNGFDLGKTDNWKSSYGGHTKHKPYFSKPGEGFEEALKVMFYKWNPSAHPKNDNYANYQKKVMDNSKLFLPRRKSK